MIAPALFLGLRLYVLVPLIGRAACRAASRCCVRLLHQAGRWNMIEVFTHRRPAVAGAPGLRSPMRCRARACWRFGATMILLAAIESAGLKHLWWQVQ